MPLNALLDQFIAAPSKLERYRLALENPILVSQEAQAALAARWRSAWDQQQLMLVEQISRWKIHLLRCAADGLGPAMFGWSDNNQPELNTRISDKIRAAMSQAAALTAPSEMPRRIAVLEQALNNTPIQSQPYLWGELTQMLAWSWMNRAGEGHAAALETARRLYEDSFSVFSRDTFPADWAFACHCLGAVCFQMQTGNYADNLERALAHFQTALTVRTQRALPVEWAYTCKFLALTYQFRQIDHQRSLGLAADTIKQSLEVFTHSQFPVEWAMAMSSLARTLLMYQGGDRGDNIDQAIEACQNALQVCAKDAMPAHWAAIMNDLARAWLERQRGDRAANLEEAISVTESALAAIVPDKQPADWVRLMIRLAAAFRNRLYGDRGINVEKAIAAYSQAADVAYQQKMTRDWALVKNNLALLYLDRLHGSSADNTEKAISACAEALTVRRRDALPESWARTQETLGAALLAREVGDPADNIDQAISAFTAALDVFTADNLPVEWATTTVSLARALLKRQRGNAAENVQQAAAACQQALRVRTRDAVPVDWAETMRLFVQAQLASGATTTSQLTSAIDSLRQCASVLHPRVMPRQRLETLTDLAEIYARQGDYAHAAAVFEEIRELDGILQIHEVTQDSQRRRIQDTARLYALASWCAAKLGDFKRTLEWAEFGRTRVLREKMARDQALFHSKITPEDRRQFERVEARLRSIEAEQRDPHTRRRSFLDVAEEAQEVWDTLTALVGRIRQYQPDFLSSGMTYQQILHCLPPEGNTAFVMFSCTNHGAAAAVLSGSPLAPREHLVFLEKLTSTSLVNLVSRWRNANAALDQRLAALPYISAFDTNAADAEQDRAIGDWEHVAEPLLIELHENLLAEVISAAGSIERLVLLPHGPMHALPLHAALRYGGQEKRYLLDDIEVSYIPSFALLRPAAGGAKRPESLLGVCNPSGDLPQSEKEVLEIAAFFSHPLVLSGARATIANVNQAADQIDVLHFACHGDLDLATPYSSCLYLAPETSTPNSDNGSSESRTRAATRLLKIVDGAATLTANSPRAPAAAEAWTLGGILRDLRIPNARLVVLSACKSGLFSESRLPDEYLGLAAGFLAAGAQTVISSLWAVPDQTTRLLMTRFYAHWLGAGLPPASALRAAQTDVRSLPGCNNPYYWAAFHVSGP